MLRIVLGLTLFACAPIVGAQGDVRSVDPDSEAVVPDSVDLASLRLEAEGFVDEGDTEAAVERYRVLVEAAPDDLGARRRFARLLTWVGETDEAREQFEIVVAADPSDRASTLELGALLTWGGQADRAVELLRPIAARDIGDAEAQTRLAFAYSAAGNTEAAGPQFTRALALSPRDPSLLLEAGAYDHWHGDWARGRERLQQAVNLGLSTDEKTRAEELLASIKTTYAPRVATRFTYATDSNEITRRVLPLAGSYVHNGQVGWGFDGSQEWLRDDAPAPSDSGAASGPFVSVLESELFRFSPYVSLTPSRTLSLRLGGGLDVTETGAPGVRASLDVRKSWVGNRYRSVGLKLRTGIGAEGVRALDARIRISAAEAEGYAEVRDGLAVGGRLVASRYSDGNLRLQSELFASQQIVEWEGAASGKMALEAGLSVDDMETTYSTSQPYWTPSGLWTGASRVSWQVQSEVWPRVGLGLSGAVGTSYQRDAFSRSQSLDYRIAPVVVHDRHTVGVRVERSGSSAYSIRTVEVTYEVALW